MRYIHIERKNEQNTKQESGLNKPCFWKKKFDITSKTSINNVSLEKNDRKKKNDKGNRRNLSLCSFLENRENAEIEVEKKRLSTKIATNLWNKLNIENENAIDLFDDRNYVNMSENDRKIFHNRFLSYFIASSQSDKEIKNSIFQETINLKGKNKKNINELKRIAIENECCLLLNCDKTDLLSEEKPLLIVSEKKFFQIIDEIVMSEDCSSSNRKNSLTVLFELSNNKENEENKKRHCYIKNSNDCGGYETDETCTTDEKELGCREFMKKTENFSNKVSYNIKEYLPIQKKEGILKKKDYKILEKENIVNDLIHLSIMELSKNANVDVGEKIKERKNKQKLIRHKKNNERIYASIVNKKGAGEQDPIKILKKFFEKDSNILDYREFLDELRCCTFQPNIHKYIEKEKKYIQERSEEKAKIEKRVSENINSNSEHLNDDTYNWIFSSLKEPLYDVEVLNMKKYLEAYETYFDNKEKNKKPLVYENATHRKSRNDFRSVSVFNMKNKCAEVQEKKKSNHADYKNKWVNELRGGYKRNVFDFSLYDKEEARCAIERSDKRKNADWGKTIRLSSRRMKTRVIPNNDLINKIIDMDYSFEEEPTNFIVKQKSAFIYENSTNGTQKRTLITSDQHKQNSGKNTCARSNSAYFQKTNFLVPTPIKTHKQQRLLRIKNELNNFKELVSFYPPKVVAVESDTILDDIKKEILALPESVRFLSKKTFNRQ